VLFLDELTEFRRDAIEALRQPLEDGQVVVTRIVGSVQFPARFTLVTAANPCPCGYEGDPKRHCRCPPNRVDSYRQKPSGPLLDRIDIRLNVPRLSKRDLLGESAGEPSAAVRARVEEARERQRTRYAPLGLPCNAQLPGPVARLGGHGHVGLSALTLPFEASSWCGDGRSMTPACRYSST
jgi:magnesium chelatase family protein